MYTQQQYPPQYGMDSVHGHPMTTQPQSAWAESQYIGGVVGKRNSTHSRPLTPPPGTLPKVISMDPEGKGNGGGGSNATTNNINTNNNNNSSNSSVVVNANVTAGAGFGSGNRLCLVGKDQLMSRDWNSGLCACFNDVVGCVLSMVCLPLALMRLANRLNECACVPCCVPGGIVALRTKLRTMGGIRGSICCDCVVGHFCCCCVACQMKREMDDMNL